MFDMLPADVADLRGVDDAALIDAVAGWSKVSAAAEARKYAAVAEFQRRRCTDEHSEWACDDWDAAAAEVGAALNIGHGRASNELDVAVMLRDRFPKVAARFMTGELNGRRAWLIWDRTCLVTDREAVAALDDAIAERITAWCPLTEYKLTQALDVWVDTIDPGALRRTQGKARSREFMVADADATGTAAVYGRLFATDAALLKARLDAMVRTVCADDPRTLPQRRADALGALAAGRSEQLSCHCGNASCPATADDGRASSITIHVLTEATSTETQPDPLLHGGAPAATEDQKPADAPVPPTRRKAGLILGGGLVPGPLLAELIARGAKLAPISTPSDTPEPRYRPSRALDEFVRMRDLTCRHPGCDRPAVFADIDHTIPYPGGPTHPGNLNCRCRKHHLVKTFWPGWSDRQLADGTLIVTTPTGHAYTTRPGSHMFFPTWDIDTPAPMATAIPPGERRTTMMPVRKRSRAKARADRIKRERALNDARVVQRNEPAPF